MSWQQLADIARQAREEREQMASRPPQACPRDGEPLIPAPGGGLGCRFDGFRWPQDAPQQGEQGSL